MATDSTEQVAGKVPCASDDEDKKLTSIGLCKEHIKTEQPSGEISNSEISESSDSNNGATSESSVGNNSTSSDTSLSPVRRVFKTVTGSSGRTYKFKRTLDDSGIDVELPSSLLAKQPRVHLGERIAISGDGHMYSVQSPGKHSSKNKKMKEKKKKSKSSKNITETYLPSRRVKREASLNAAARVNIMYEKDVSPPKVGRKPSSSSTASAVTKKSNVTPKKSLSKKVNKDSDKNIKKTKGKVESGKSKDRTKSAVKRLKVDKEMKGRKVTPNKNGTSPKNTKTKSIVSKYKRLSGNKANKSSDRTLNKTKKLDNKQTKKRKFSDKDQIKSKTKKVKTDTQRAARTDLSTAPKKQYPGVQCMGCYQHAMCSSKGKLYWGNSDFGEGKEGEIISEETGCHLDSSPPSYTSVPPHVQIVEGSPYVNTVVPHQTLPACPRCAQRSGLITTPPCQSYTLGGLGSISSVQVVSYPQHFGSSFPITYPTSHSALPHCGCGACYSASGIYYPSTTTPMPHQPLPHDTCHGAPTSIHVAESEESKSDVDIDVGEPDDIKPIMSSVTLKETSNEKSQRKTSVSSMKGGSQKKSADKKVTLQESKAKKAAEKVFEKQKSKEMKKKPKYNKSISRHGWEFDGEPERKKVMSLWLGMSVETNCYQAIRHVDGDLIRVRECVLLCSGPKKTDIPYVAKVTNFWEHPHDGEMMMSLLWYYQPEHTESGRKSHHADCEVFASKHKDENSVACIDDKGYVLTFAEYCRYRAEVQRQESGIPPQPKVVPSPEDDYIRCGKLPPQGCDPNNVYLCRQVYDFKLKRILKNPS
ncbi:uncharacterized protein LOC117324171 [Pecten maximus]|uniref:uncharacterized protein LOC117324171 n=1 Tax=Pecten maximus TaxID=6579 RepID=UPI0014588C26|nr:uncharacterized protein LOC117324171 [Pecten maximus]